MANYAEVQWTASEKAEDGRRREVLGGLWHELPSLTSGSSKCYHILSAVFGGGAQGQSRYLGAEEAGWHRSNKFLVSGPVSRRARVLFQLDLPALRGRLAFLLRLKTSFPPSRIGVCAT